MSFLLDTNICSYYVKYRRRLTHRFFQHSGRLYTTTIVLSELYTWAYKRSDPTRLLLAIDGQLLPQLHVLDFTQECAKQFGKLSAAASRNGIGFSPLDWMIASVALVHDLTLITANTRHFDRVPDLRLDNWS